MEAAQAEIIVGALRAATVRLLLLGALLTGAVLTLVISQARFGSPLFFATLAAAAAAHIGACVTMRRVPPDRRLLLAAFAVSVACRAILAVGPVNYDSDMIRYIYDGRVQRLGYNPYALVPSDPALAATHTAETARMPSRHDRTPYPPAAQLFFRAMVTVTESPQAMKFALAFFDVLTILILWRWLAATGRSQWLALAYAWNPLVVLEVGHSGHIDALGAMWIAASAWWLTRRRTLLASLAFTLAVATKLLPIVLAPLFLGRVRPRDIAAGAALLLALYLPFMSGTDLLPIGAVPNVVAHIRFNSPIFRPLAWFVPASGVAAIAVLAGLTTAAWARWRLAASDPAAWAWPMAIALACAPVIYPWYLLYFTPFLLTPATLPLTVWTYTVLPVYVVWERARNGARWRVPTELMVAEYGLVLVAAAVMLYMWRGRARGTVPDAAPGALPTGR